MKSDLKPIRWPGRLIAVSFAAFLAVPLALQAGDEWAKSKDGVVGLQFRAKTEPMNANDRLVLVAVVRNFSAKPITVLKPLGGPFVGMPIGLQMKGPKGDVKYIGPVIEPRAHVSRYRSPA